MSEHSSRIPHQWSLTIYHFIHIARCLLFTMEVRTVQFLSSEVEVPVGAGVEGVTQGPCHVVGHEGDHHLQDRQGVVAGHSPLQLATLFNLAAACKIVGSQPLGHKRVIRKWV